MIPEKMKAAAMDRFGGPEVIHTETLPVPRPEPDEVLIQLDVSGIGVWDPWLREGTSEFNLGDTFPQVLGNDGAGTVVAVGKDVKRFRVGDHVYAYSMKGGFYAEYVAVDEDEVAKIPRGLEPEEAGALGADGITALCGLEALKLRRGQKLMIFGASGGIGHIAVQLAKKMGLTVLAVASQQDGVALVKRLGADVAVDGHADDVGGVARDFAPNAALVLTSGKGLEEALAGVRKIAFPNGVEPVPEGPAGAKLVAFNGTPSPDAFERLNRLIGDGPFHVELGHMYKLDDAAKAHREIGKHHLGKLALRLH